MRLKPLSEQVVVIFGASSGIGRGAALRMADAGARLVVAARDSEGLDTLVSEIRNRGGRAIPVVADAAAFHQVKAVADRAVEEYGHLDTWVHSASVMIYASFEETTPEEFARVIDVNLLGAAHGAMAALPYLKREPGAALIFLSSMEGQRALPLGSAYGASKHGLDGMIEALRLELEHDGVPVSVTKIVPASTNTPMFDKARTKLGVKPRGYPPLYDPNVAVDAIVHAATHPTRDLMAGGGARMMTLLNRLAPGAADRFLMGTAYELQQTDEPRPKDYAGNLFEPVDGYATVTGSYSEEAKPSSAYAWLQTHPRSKRLLMLAAGSGIALTAAGAMGGLRFARMAPRLPRMAATAGLVMARAGRAAGGPVGRASRLLGRPLGEAAGVTAGPTSRALTLASKPIMAAVAAIARRRQPQRRGWRGFVAQVAEIARRSPAMARHGRAPDRSLPSQAKTYVVERLTSVVRR